MMKDGCFPTLAASQANCAATTVKRARLLRCRAYGKRMIQVKIKTCHGKL